MKSSCWVGVPSQLRIQKPGICNVITKFDYESLTKMPGFFIAADYFRDFGIRYVSPPPLVIIARNLFLSVDLTGKV